MTNALNEVPWVRTSSGALTVREALLHAHEIEGLDLTRPGLEVSSTYRLLCQVFALVAREMGTSNIYSRANALDPQAIDKAIDKIGGAADLFDGSQPFMQRPALKPAGPKDTSRRIGPQDQPIKKLFPFMPPDQAEKFWSLAVQTPDVLELPDAVRALVVFHFFSLAGNNAYAGDKCMMGAPGIRYPGKDNTSTEIMWKGESLLRTLRLNTPVPWIEDGGLPAWADRTGELSRNEANGELPSLWTASWSSNTTATYWENGKLAGVRTGGVPGAWLPFSSSDKDSLKQWWDVRNTADPFYLYMADKTGVKRAQRLDLQRDVIDLAVEWNAASKSEDLKGARTPAVYPEIEDELVFFRHQVGGTASSPSIRASEVLVGDRSIWAPDDSVADDVRLFSEMIRRLHSTVRGRFRRIRTAESKADREPPVLDALESRANDASAYFWREIAESFYHYIEHVDDDSSLDDEDLRLIEEATLRAFDKAAAPFASQHRQKVAYVRAYVKNSTRSIIRTRDEGTSDNERSRTSHNE